jgi:hypothetical protein
MTLNFAKSLFFSALLLIQPIIVTAQVQLNEPAASAEDNPAFCETQLIPRDMIVRLRWMGRIEKIVQGILEKKPSYTVTNSFSPTKFIEEIALDARTLDNKWKPVAKSVHDLLGDHKFMAQFVREYLTEVLEESIRNGEFADKNDHLSKLAAATVLRRRAAASGWSNVVWFNGASDQHFSDMLSEGYIFRDMGIFQPRHTQDGHMLQILAVAPEIDRLYGPNTMRQFLKHIGKLRRKDAWDNIFDLPPSHYWNFHSPAAFADFEVVEVFESYTRMRTPDEPIWRPR